MKIKLTTLIFVAIFLVNCSDTIEKQMGMEIISSEEELPECAKENEGEQVFVKDEDAPRICVDGSWKKDASSTSNGDSDFSCSTKELADKSGIKIICNGDSVGVVLNGEKGAPGKDGKDGDKGVPGEKGTVGKEGSDCTVNTDTLKLIVTITCGDNTTTIDLLDLVNTDSAVIDSEAIAISLDSLAGYSQKGPFLKGSTVYLYELADGRTLKQTNGNFTSSIMRDDGYYKFNARDLVSQYALIVIDGHYRDEVTGKVSDGAIKLKAISDVHKHSAGANVNILTHLEYERVYYLVTKKKMKVSAAKRQAQREILKQFYIELDGDRDSENMDVFGNSDADAALLALSILLQGDRSVADLTALLTEISSDMAQDGTWDDSTNKVDSVKTAIAEWAFDQDLSEFRANVDGWNLGNGVGDFETFIRNYIAKIYGIVPCGDGDNGSTRTIKNELSKHNAKTYTCYNGVLITPRIENQFLNPDIEYGKMIDSRDRKMYSTIKIGNQVWMAENLDYADSIAYPALQGRSWCYDDNPDNCDTLGRLYTWAAAMDSSATFSINGIGCGWYKECLPVYPVRGICPNGWHLPSRQEWDMMLAVVQEQFGSGKILRSKTEWPDGDDDTDGIGFSACPTGYVCRAYSDSSFCDFGNVAYFRTSTKTELHPDGSSYVMRLNTDAKTDQTIGHDQAASVRCIKD